MDKVYLFLLPLSRRHLEQHIDILCLQNNPVILQDSETNFSEMFQLFDMWYFEDHWNFWSFTS